jgi:hypothetical protein
MQYVIEQYARKLSEFPQQHSCSAGELHRELGERNIAWARQTRAAHEISLGFVPAVLYGEDELGRHGNFHPASYARIQRNPDWRARLRKTHTSARKVLVSRETRCELDSSNSSDALLMSIFCHPQNARTGNRVYALLGASNKVKPEFGYRPRIALKNGRYDRTEIDLRLGTLLIEAKLTESDFQSAPIRLVERYRDLETVFDVESLPRAAESMQSYQLLRGILAAHAEADARFCVLCDARRSDLIESWYTVMRCVRNPDLRCRLGLLNWQEVSAACGAPLQRWLSAKYGITHRVA